MALKQIGIINPGPAPKKKRTGKKNKSKKGVVSTMAAKKKSTTGKRGKGRSKSRARGKKNSSAVKYAPSKPAVQNRKKGRKKGYKKGKRNPETMTAAMDPTKGYNILEYSAGAAIGAIAVPIAGNMIETMMPSVTGPLKYAAQGGISYLGYRVAKYMGMPKLGLAIGIAGVGITLFQAAQDYGVISGIENTLLGNNEDVIYMDTFRRNLNNANVSGIMPSNMHGIMPSNMSGIMPFNNGTMNGHTPGHMETSIQMGPAVNGFDKSVY